MSIGVMKHGVFPNARCISLKCALLIRKSTLHLGKQHVAFLPNATCIFGVQTG